MNKKILTTSLMVVMLNPVISYAQDYVLNKSNFNSTVTFEKVPSKANTTDMELFKLVKKDDGSFLFKKKDNHDNIWNNNNIDKGYNVNTNDVPNVKQFISLGEQESQTKAISTCNSYKGDNQSWHLISKDDVKKLNSFGTDIDSNILSFFESEAHNKNIWGISDEFYKNDPERPVNAFAIVTSNNMFEYYNMIESFPSITICVSDSFK